MTSLMFLTRIVALQKEYPKMTDCLLGMVAPTLILRDPTTHQPRGIVR